MLLIEPTELNDMQQAYNRLRKQGLEVNAIEAQPETDPGDWMSPGTKLSGALEKYRNLDAILHGKLIKYLDAHKDGLISTQDLAELFERITI